jgi:hypothetical protein
LAGISASAIDLAKEAKAASPSGPMRYIDTLISCKDVLADFNDDVNLEKSIFPVSTFTASFNANFSEMISSLALVSPDDNDLEKLVFFVILFN